MTPFQRFWTYQRERFPLFKTVSLLAVFSAASINISGLLAGRALPGAGAYAAAFLAVLIVFFQMRAADEWKDREIDRLYRPERAIPRGLVRLSTVLLIALALVPVALGAALRVGAVAVRFLLPVWLWLSAMTLEFGVPRWLVAHPMVYLVSHMAIMPLIDLFLTGIEWGGRGGPAPALWLFLALSFVNGCVLEIGRKTWAHCRGGVRRAALRGSGRCGLSGERHHAARRCGAGAGGRAGTARPRPFPPSSCRPWCLPAPPGWPFPPIRVLVRAVPP